MPVVVAVQVWYWMTNFQNGVLNYILTKLGLGDYFQHDWFDHPHLAARDGDLADRLGRDPVRRRHRLRGARAGARTSSSRPPRSTARAPWRIFRDVTFPILKPIFLILTSLSIIWDFGVFTQPFLLIGQSHVSTSNYLMGVYLYEEGYAQERLRARRGDLDPDAADRGRA